MQDIQGPLDPRVRRRIGIGGARIRQKDESLEGILRQQIAARMPALEMGVNLVECPNQPPSCRVPADR